eukprot:XP_022283225.1 juxtaposed with another zinc finger protein 1 isoform X1 [Canis lupus familiaris]
MTDAARREQESLKKKIQPKLSLTLSSSVSRGNVSTPPRHSSGSLTPPVTPPITPSSSFRSSTPTGKKINVVGDKAGSTGFRRSPCRRPASWGSLPSRAGIGRRGAFPAASPRSEFTRVTLLSRPYEPIKSSLAGISKLQSRSRTECLKSLRAFEDRGPLWRPAVHTRAGPSLREGEWELAHRLPPAEARDPGW